MATKVSEAYYGERTAVIGGVCHGVLGLVNAKDKEGNTLIAGRRMTGVTDKQVKELGIEITPLHPETELRKAGALFREPDRLPGYCSLPTWWSMTNNGLSPGKTKTQASRRRTA